MGVCVLVCGVGCVCCGSIERECVLAVWGSIEQNNNVRTWGAIYGVREGFCVCIFESVRVWECTLS
jgi:hypothetical protein